MPTDTRGQPRIDEGVLAPLLEESDDLHADSMVKTKEALAVMVENGQEQRSRTIDLEETMTFEENRSRLMPTSFGGPLLAGIGAGAALAAVMASPAFASSPTDIQILQTAASIEVLAVATYTTALTLTFIGGSSANGVVKAFVTKTKAQHATHLKAFNAAIQKLGGTTQTSPDPVLLTVVNKAKPGLTSALAVVTLALELEQGAAETYVANVAALTDSNAKAVTASIMGVEAQHAAILRAVQALLKATAPQLIALPPSPLTTLPAAAGSVGFPTAFFPTKTARPETEGAVKS